MNKKIVMPKKAKIAVGIIVSVVCLLNTYQAKADTVTTAEVVLQSNSSGTAYTNNFNGQFKAIREMEASGGTLGLNSTIVETAAGKWLDDTPKIDSHMAKTTEWGAVAILTISSYGAGAATFTGNGTISASSTNNATGIYGLANGWEYVAGCYTSANNDEWTSNIYQADNRYKDVYTSEANYKNGRSNGSALEFKGWLGASYSGWVNALDPVFIRGGGGLFSFSGYYSGSGSYSSRAVVDCSSGL